MLAKRIQVHQLAGLVVGTGLAASIHLGIRLIPFESHFFNYAGVLYFSAGLLFGCLVPALSWRGGIWIAVPWIVRTFFVIAGEVFKNGMPPGIGWLLMLLLYSFPILPAMAGTFAGSLLVRMVSTIIKK